MKKIRVRFSVVPACPLSASRGRIALYNWLFARKEGGAFVLRFEDIELPPAAEKGEENLLGDLRWLKLEWTEGPDIGGSFGPYRQSLRLKLYQRYAKDLVRNGAAYPCYCLPAEKEKRREASRRRGRMEAYDNVCRDLSPEERSRMELEGRRPSIRFRVPSAGGSIRDLIRGAISPDISRLSDFVILRPDGTPTPEFANVLDDALMEITHVLRGEEGLAGIARESLLFEALGFPVPLYAHFPLLLGPARRPLEEDDQTSSLRSWREKGYLADAAANYLFLLGRRSLPGKEIMDRRAMIDAFSFSDFSPAPAIFDQEALRRVGAEHIRRTEPEHLADLAIPFLKASGVLPDTVSEETYSRMVKLAAVFRNHLGCLSEIALYAPIFSGRPIAPADSRAARALAAPKVALYLAGLGKEFARSKLSPETFWRETLSRLRERPERERKEISLGLRAALAGRSEGPELLEFVHLIPAALVKRRLRVSKNKTG
jgi:nondiscriminating glutamyl-tRNA synthetase